MGLSDDQINILEEVVELDGNCMSAARCRKCPLRASCLPEFLTTKPPSPEERKKKALSIIMHHCMIDEESSADADLHKYNK